MITTQITKSKRKEKTESYLIQARAFSFLVEFSKIAS